VDHQLGRPEDHGPAEIVHVCDHRPARPQVCGPTRDHAGVRGGSVGRSGGPVERGAGGAEEWFWRIRVPTACGAVAPPAYGAGLGM
jgi:hypothetical protein